VSPDELISANDVAAWKLPLSSVPGRTRHASGHLIQLQEMDMNATNVAVARFERLHADQTVIDHARKLLIDADLPSFDQTSAAAAANWSHR
jgi:hypothetical protein